VSEIVGEEMIDRVEMVAEHDRRSGGLRISVRWWETEEWMRVDPVPITQEAFAITWPVRQMHPVMALEAIVTGAHRAVKQARADAHRANATSDRTYERVRDLHGKLGRLWWSTWLRAWQDIGNAFAGCGTVP